MFKPVSFAVGQLPGSFPGRIGKAHHTNNTRAQSPQNAGGIPDGQSPGGSAIPPGADSGVNDVPGIMYPPPIPGLTHQDLKCIPGDRTTVFPFFGCPVPKSGIAGIEDEAQKEAGIHTLCRISAWISGS